MCMKCPGGYACDGSSTQTQCPAGKHSTAGSSTCTACGDDKLYSGLGSSSCNTCPAGSFTSGGLDQTTRTDCSPCPPGHECSDGSSVKTPCIAGKYASGSATACLVCGADHLYSAGGSAASRCDLCRPGSFTAGGTATARHTCTKCWAGYTCDGTSDTSTQCSAGTFAAKGSFYCTPCGNDNMFSGVGAGVCAVCGPGSFTGGGSSTTRQTCAACTAGSKCSGTSVQVKCDVGTFSTAGQSACADCGADNLYSGTPGTADACVTCAAGSVTYGGNPTTRTTCEACSPGYKCVGTSSIVTCGAGFFSAAGSSACAKCADGTKYSQPAAAACSTCAIGYFTSGNTKETRTTCSVCPAGFACDGTNAKQLCPAGKFSGAGSAVCSPCGGGKKFSSAGAGSCGVCSPGFRTTGGADDTTRTQCDLCDAGSACDGSSTPTLCDKGKYAPGGSSSCLAVR